MTNPGGIGIPISATLNPADVEKSIAQFTAQLNKLGSVIAKMNKAKFDPIGKGTIEDLKKVAAQMEAIKRVQGGLRQRLGATGQAGASLGDINWQAAYPDPASRNRAMRMAYEQATAGTSFGRNFGNGAGGGAGAGRAPHPQSGGGGGGGFVPRVVGAALGGMGGGAATAGSALSAGLAGGLAGGLASLIVGIVGKAASAISDKIGDAQQEFVGYDTLKRTLGDVNVSFDMLKKSVRGAAEGMGYTYAEALKMSGTWARTSGGGGMRGEIANAGGFARSMGIDGDGATSYFAQMRQFGVTRDDAGSKRQALLIGEAVAKSGATGKTDEIMRLVAGFVSTQSRLSLGVANTSGYAGMLAGLVSTHAPGLDVGGAGAIIGNVNSSIVGGGSQAFQNYLYATLGRRNGLNPMQSQLLQGAGAFGSGASVFGGQVYQDFARKYGVGTPRMAGSSGTNLDAIMGGLHAQSRGNPWLEMNMVSTNLGVNASQAMALMAYGGRGGGLGAIGKRLGAGFDMTRLNSGSIQALAAINGGDASVLDAQAASLRGRKGSDALSSSERQQLSEAMKGGNMETIKDVLSKLTATRDQESTEGKATRDAIVEVGNITQKMAGELVGPINVMKDAMVSMVMTLAPKSSFATAANSARDLEARRSALAQIEGGDRTGLNAGRNMSDAQVLAKNFGAGSGASLWLATMQQESGGHQFKADGTPLMSEAGAVGISQMLPSTGPEAAKLAGVAWNENSFKNDAKYNSTLGHAYLDHLIRLYNGDKVKALSAYHSGEGTVNDAIAKQINATGSEEGWQANLGPVGRGYANSVLSRKTSTPRGASEDTGNAIAQAQIDMLVNPIYANGSSAGQPVRTRVGFPLPQGLR
jgi:hypothetical protein